MRQLSARQRAFCAAYAADPSSAAGAARRAGYSAGSARSVASRLLARTLIRTTIAEEQARLAAPAGDIDKAGVMRDLARLARASLLDFARRGEDGRLELPDSLDEIDPDLAPAIKRWKVVETTLKDGETRRTVDIELIDRLPVLIRLFDRAPERSPWDRFDAFRRELLALEPEAFIEAKREAGLGGGAPWTAERASAAEAAEARRAFALKMRPMYEAGARAAEKAKEDAYMAELARRGQECREALAARGIRSLDPPGTPTFSQGRR